MVISERIKNHANIGCMWSAYLQAKTGMHITLSPGDAACMMSLLKIARTLAGAHNTDDYIDCVGYVAIAGGIAEQIAAVADQVTAGGE
jgi:hypothetical protein